MTTNDSGLDAASNRDRPLKLAYRPPYRYGEILHFLAGRAIPSVEVVTEAEYMRSVEVRTGANGVCGGWIRVGHLERESALSVTVSETLLPVLSHVLARVRHLFDLDCDPQVMHEVLAPMNQIRPGLYEPGRRLPGCFNAFEMAVRAILGQQITVRAATTLAGRFVAAFGEPIETPHPDITHLFPLPETILGLEGGIEDHLGPLGITSMRARAIRGLAEGFSKGTIRFDPAAEPEAEIERLLKLPGIGPWTAQYIAMRTMGWTDAFLETDAGVKKALAPRTAKEMLRMAEAWRPWRSYAVINLWSSLYN